jgi:hypothetical protein
MNIRYLAYVSVLAALLVTPGESTAHRSNPDADGPARCSLEAAFQVHPGEAIVLARPTGERVELPPPEWLRSDSLTAVNAFRFEVLEVAGEASVVTSRDITVVPLNIGPTCRVYQVPRDQWVRQRDVVFVLGPAIDLGGQTVYTTLIDLNPYPIARGFRVGAWVGDARPDEWLTSAEYFSLLSHLPVRDAEEPSEDHALNWIEVFAEGNPRWSTIYPGARILELMKMSVERR